MKKLVLVLMMVCAFAAAQAQSSVSKGIVKTFIDSLDLSTISGADTTIYVTARNGAWGVDIQFESITGSGTAEIVAGHDASSLELYNTSSTTTVTGASGTFKWDDSYLAWKYVGIKITLNTISAGKLNATIMIR